MRNVCKPPPCWPSSTSKSDLRVVFHSAVRNLPNLHSVTRCEGGDLVAFAHPSIETAPFPVVSLNTGAAVIGFHHCTMRPRTNLASF